MSEPTQSQHQEPRFGPRTLRYYIRESFRSLDFLEGKRQAYIDAHLTTTPGSAPTSANNNNAPTFFGRGNDLERQRLLNFRRIYHAALTELRDLIVQLPEDQFVARKRYQRHFLIRVNRILDRMTIELRESTAAAVGDAGPADASAFVLVGGRKKRRRVYGGAHHLIVRMHQDVMTEFISLFNEFATKY